MPVKKNGIQMTPLMSKLYFTTNAHLGGFKTTEQMKDYVYQQRNDRLHVFNVDKFWDKIILAARAIAAYKHPKSIMAISCKQNGVKPVSKFAEVIGCTRQTGRFVAGTLTNVQIKNSVEPALIVVSDPFTDAQAISEARKVGVPVIAFANADADLRFVDIAIPCNTRSPKSIGACFFMLARLVDYLKTGKSIDENMEQVELFFTRPQVELDALKAEAEAKEDILGKVEGYTPSVDVSHTSTWVDTVVDSEWSQVDNDRRWE